MYTLEKHFKRWRWTRPAFYYHPWVSPVVRVGIVFAGYLLGDYIVTSPLRRGANSQLAALYTNNEFLKTREMFVYNFEISTLHTF